MMAQVTRSGVRRLVALAIVGALSVASAHAAEVTVHYAPTENLEKVDIALIGGAREAIDIAGYVVTDWPVIDALVTAQARGVAVRLVLDPSQRHNLERLAPLLPTTRMKPKGPFMHLKSYAVDGRVLRSGSANFTASGLKQQNNDLLVIEDDAAVAAFEREFERLWDRSHDMVPASP